MRQAISLCFVFLFFLFPLTSFGEMEAVENVGESGFVAPFLRVAKEIFQTEETQKLPYENEVREYLFSIHLFLVADVPYEYGLYTYRAAKSLDEDPYDLASLLISEHSGRDDDFSFEGSKGYHYTFDYDPSSVGSGGEIGLYQLKPRWARKAAKFYSTDWKAQDLYDPEINTKAAAYVMYQLKKNHLEDCDGENSWHTWTAHYKCARKSRDDLRGRCRFAQRKWDKVRFSLVNFGSADTKAIGEAHNDRLRVLIDKHQRKSKYVLRKRVQKLCKMHEIPIPENLRKMSLEELEQELMWMKEAAGGEAAEGGD